MQITFGIDPYLYLTLLLLLLSFTICIQLWYLFVYHRQSLLPTTQTDNAQQETDKPISIIICAKNEAQQLVKNLPLILKQDYYADGKINYEVIVVNDDSTDDTEIILRQIASSNNHLKTINSSGGKKKALTAAMQVAANNYLLLTDADCQPVSNQWVKEMMQPLFSGKMIVAGYGAYTQKYGVLNKIIQFETLHTYMQYSGYALSGNPYMAVGRNMAVTKDVLTNVAASSRWNALPYGDDDMLVAIAATKNNFAIVANKQSHTLSEPKKTYGFWLAQKKRHLSTGKYYNKKTKVLLSGYALSHGLFWLSVIISFIMHPSIALVLFLSRSVPVWWLLTTLNKKLKTNIPILLLPLLDFGWMVYNFALSPYILFKNRKTWK